MAEIGRLGAVELVCQSMQMHRLEPEVQGRACGVMYNLAFNDGTPSTADHRHCGSSYL
jgi:hypothetical protein